MSKRPKPLPLGRSGPRCLCEVESPYGSLFVLEIDGLHVLRFNDLDSLDQSAADPLDQSRIVTPYVRLLLGGCLHISEVKRCLIMGLGGGRFPMLLRRTLPEVEVDTVEINPKMVEVAKKYFGFSPDEHNRVHVSDAETFISRLEHEQTFDIILVDLYDGEGGASAMFNPRFLWHVRRGVSSDGVVIINLALEEDEESEVLEILYKVFKCVRIYEASDRCNLIVFAASRRLPTHAEVCARARVWRPATELGFNLEAELRGGFMRELSLR